MPTMQPIFSGAFGGEFAGYGLEDDEASTAIQAAARGRQARQQQQLSLIHI